MGWDWVGLGWVGMVIIGCGQSKSTFGANKYDALFIPIWPLSSTTGPE